MSIGKSLLGALTLAGLTAAATLIPASPLHISPVADMTKTVTTPYSCRLNTPNGPVPGVPFGTTGEHTTPDAVKVGDQFEVTFDALPADVPQLLKEYRNTWIKVPAATGNVTLKSWRLTGGNDNLGTKPTLELKGGDLYLIIPGPTTGHYDIPAVHLTYQADKAGTVDYQPVGKSYDDPGSKTEWVGIDGSVTPADCYPTDPKPSLGSTVIK
ncbi:hypothetical protein D5S17_08580 [Pseudonocardiaceae bacterium YIM PH 21723]|nr:hypothetical protein D5S17_08580 [Pseudonocardiaceae bacterium YIM PH 21723]